MIKLPQQEHLQISPNYLTMRASLQFCITERPEKLFSINQCDTESYTDLIVDFLLFDEHDYTHGIFRSVILISIIILQAYISFSLFLKV